MLSEPTQFNQFVLLALVFLPLILAVRSLWKHNLKNTFLYVALMFFGIHVVLAAMAENSRATVSAAMLDGDPTAENAGSGVSYLPDITFQLLVWAGIASAVLWLIFVLKDKFFGESTGYGEEHEGYAEDYQHHNSA